MATYNPLNWQNESELGDYPFVSGVEPKGLIVDAAFIQFDNFLPTLVSITIDTERIIVTLTCDQETVEASMYKEVFMLGLGYRNVRVYSKDSSRYLGTLAFGEETSNIWTTYLGRVFSYSTPFLQSVVKSIPLNDAVYKLDDSYGDVLLSRTVDDSSIFFNASSNTDYNSVTFNAVQGHAVPSTSSRVTALKQINLVRPIKNNINLLSNDVIKFSPLNGASLSIDLVSGSVSSSFSIPSLTS